MKISLENLKYNLNLLEDVKKEYPILQGYQDGTVLHSTISRADLDKFVRFVDHMKATNQLGIKVYYEEKITYNVLRDKLVEVETSEVAKRIFKNKSRADFHKLWLNKNLVTKYYEQFVATGGRRGRGSKTRKTYARCLSICQPMIINYLAQHEVDVDPNVYMRFNDQEMYFNKIDKPIFHTRELNMTQDFLSEFIKFTKRKKLDVRKSNIKMLTDMLQQKLSEMMVIGKGASVSCISETNGFTIGKLYIVIESRVDYNGFLEIKIVDDNKNSRFIPYTNFEEVARKRDDLLDKLGI